MKDLKQYISRYSIGFSLLIALFINYPNIIYFYWDLKFGKFGLTFTEYLLFFLFRYFFFCCLSWLLLRQNLLKNIQQTFYQRIFRNFKITTVAYLIYVSFSLWMSKHMDCFTGYLLFQFLVVLVLFTLTGHAFSLYLEQLKKDKEIEELKFENLKSKTDALANQINPHFLFNTLNTLTFLVREDNKEQSLEFINKLSNIFRYILQSDKNGIVTLKEELKFAESFLFLMETRFANKLVFIIKVDPKFEVFKLPALSLLPLLENVVMHNIIDSEHKMQVEIMVNEQDELVVSNPLYPKTDPVISNGTGLTNLRNRFSLMMGTEIRLENDRKTFSVYLPLKA